MVNKLKLKTLFDAETTKLIPFTVSKLFSKLTLEFKSAM